MLGLALGHTHKSKPTIYFSLDSNYFFSVNIYLSLFVLTAIKLGNYSISYNHGISTRLLNQ